MGILPKKSAGGKSGMKTEEAALSELPILVGDNRVARIPFPMTEEFYALLVKTIELWKPQLVKPAESRISPTEEDK
jgi:hypothetical protein